MLIEMASNGRRRKSEEWDSREREWINEMRQSIDARQAKPGSKIKKFNPKRRFKFMIFWLSVVLVSFIIALLTIVDPKTTYQAVFSSFSALISGGAFVINYGRDIVFAILNILSKNSLR
jgi:hypothetical protein